MCHKNVRAQYCNPISIKTGGVLYWTLCVTLSHIKITYLPTENLQRRRRPIGISLPEYVGILLYIQGCKTAVNYPVPILRLAGTLSALSCSAPSHFVQQWHTTPVPRCGSTIALVMIPLPLCGCVSSGSRLTVRFPPPASSSAGQQIKSTQRVHLQRWTPRITVLPGRW